MASHFPSPGTTQFDHNPVKSFQDMYAQFKTMIETGDICMFATADDGIVATRIAREPTTNKGKHKKTKNKKVLVCAHRWPKPCRWRM